MMPNLMNMRNDYGLIWKREIYDICSLLREHNIFVTFVISRWVLQRYCRFYTCGKTTVREAAIQLQN